MELQFTNSQTSGHGQKHKTFSDPADAIQKAGKSSRTTPGHILIVDARKYMVGIIVVQ
jgi:hypothetical protein